MSVTGEPRRYLGDANAWVWYRMIGTGPDPCTSGLQALEFVCDQILAKGSTPPRELIHLLLSGCENLAMVSLAYGIMVRHIEDFDGIIDPFLTEPYLWEVESDRVTYELAGRVSGSAHFASVDRRRWTPRQVVLWLLVGNGSRREPGAGTQEPRQLVLRPRQERTRRPFRLRRAA